MRIGNGRKLALWGLLALLSVGGAGGFLLGKPNDPGDRYVTAPVERGDIEESVAATGVLQPVEFVDVGTQVTGQIQALHVQVGSQVGRGQLVAEIDPTLFAAKAAASRATVESLRAQLADRIAQHRLAQQLHARNQTLFANDAVSRELLEQSAAAEAQAAAQADSFRAQVEQAQAQRDSDETTLRYTKIYAPMAGTVVSINARLGQTVVSTQQATVILRIADLRTMTVWAQVSEADVPKIPLTTPARFNTLGEVERRWEGTVRQILPMPEVVNEVILYNVLFDVANADQALKPRMSAQVDFVLAQAPDALLVPVTALQPMRSKSKEAAGIEAVPTAKAAESPPKTKTKAPKAAKAKPRTYLVRVLKDGRVEEREVEVGIVTRFSAQVVSGLAEGEAVVVGAAGDKAAGKGGKDKKSKSLPKLG